MYQLASPAARAVRTVLVGIAIAVAGLPAWTQTPEIEPPTRGEPSLAHERPADMSTSAYDPRLAIDIDDERLAAVVKAAALLFTYVQDFEGSNAKHDFKG